jgi:hypothetical protein
MTRLALWLSLLTILSLACSLGGSAQDATGPPAEGVPMSRATPTPAEQDQPPTEAVVEPTPGTPVAGGSAQSPSPIRVEPVDDQVPVEIVDMNVRFDVLSPVLFGFVQNVSEATLSSVELTIVFFDADGNEAGTSSGYTIFALIPPGELSPFEIYFPDGVPADVESIGLAAHWNPDYGGSTATREGFNVQVTGSQWTDFGFEVSGTVQNSNTRRARSVYLAFAFYNAQGRLIGLYADIVEDVEAGETDQFKRNIVPLYFSETEVDRIEIIYEGYFEG